MLLFTYSADLVHHFEKEGWTCDDCKVCLVCGESQTNEDLIICEYCDEGVHYTCLDPPPEKRPKVWDCDECLIERGKPPNNNVRKRNGLESGRNLPRISTTSHLIGMSSGAVNKQGAIRIKVDGPSGDDTATGSGSSSDSSNESDEESEGRRKSRRNKNASESSNTTSNSFFQNNFKDNQSGKKQMNKSILMNSSSSSLPGNNSLLSYRNNESTFKTDEEDNGAGAEKPSGIGSSTDKAQDSDSAQHSLIDSLINQTKQKFLPKSSKRKAEKLSKKQRKQQEKEQRLKEEQERKLKDEATKDEKDVKEHVADSPKSVKEKLGPVAASQLHNGSPDKSDDKEDEVEVKKEEEDAIESPNSDKKKQANNGEVESTKSLSIATEMQNGKDDVSKKGKKNETSPTKHSANTRSLPVMDALEPLTTSTAETGTTGASSTAGTATTTSATDTNTDNATTTEDDDDDIPLAARKSQKNNSRKKGKKRGMLSRAAKINSASENESQEEMEIATSNKTSNKNDAESKGKSSPSPAKVNKPKGLVDSLSKYFTPGGRRAVTSRTALSSLIGSASSPTRRSADSALTMIHSANANSTDGIGMKRKRGSATAFLSGSSDGEDIHETSNSLKKAAKKSKRNKSLDSASHGSNTIANLKKSAAGTSSAHSDSETGTGGLHERKRHTSGGGQLRSLYDGLSHLYTDCDSRLRHIPSTNYAPEKRRKLTDLQESGMKRLRSLEIFDHFYNYQFHYHF